MPNKEAVAGNITNEQGEFDATKAYAHILQVITEMGTAHTKELEKVASRFAKLEGRVTALKSAESKQDAPAPPASAPVLPAVAVPEGIQACVDRLLGPAVGVRVQPAKDSPDFTIHLTIPASLSKSPSQPDVRSKIFNSVQGIAGITSWVELVRRNIFTTFQRAGEAVDLPS